MRIVWEINGNWSLKCAVYYLGPVEKFLFHFLLDVLSVLQLKTKIDEKWG